ncbi:MAG TPA: oligopeptidase B [Flavobacteriales bacterium]|jgi:oligopeptidase B|nr:oligopeptidase B [Flavobacteriales bacterium]
MNAASTYLSSLTLLIAMASCNMKEKTQIQMKIPPVAKKIQKKLTEHDDVRQDPYYWMNERDHPDIIKYLNEENEYTEQSLQPQTELRKSLFEELKGRIKEEDLSVPYKKRGYYYYSRYETGKEYAVNCRKKGSLDAPEEITVNQNLRAEGKTFYSLGGLSVSNDNRIAALGEDFLGRRIYSITFKYLEDETFLSDQLDNTTGRVVWAADDQAVFYMQKDEALRPYRVYRHVMGTDQSKDVLIFEETDPKFNCSIGKTKSDQYILIYSTSSTTTEVRYFPAAEPFSEPVIFQPRTQGVEYSVAHFGSNWYIHTNYKALNFMLMKTPLNQTSIDKWVGFIPQQDDILLEDFEVFRNFLVLTERTKGLIRFHIKPWDNSEAHFISFEDPTYLAYASYNPEYDTPRFRFVYSSLTTPTTVYDYNMSTKEKDLLKQYEVVGGHEPSDYKSERVWARATDGAQVPVSIVYKKSLYKKGENPLLLYGYGSYGYSIDAFFSSSRLSLLDRGFVFAIAHVRGGEELGRRWYEDGKMLNKKNTFTDFIACGEHLRVQGYANPESIYCQGGSAGGLLVGAVINMRPDLWKGAIAQVPFVDVLTTMLDESIPLTTGEFEEWGNPKNKEYYDYIKSYSPYDNVTQQDYPNLLVTSGYHDSQVQYWEPTKWVAKLRAEKTDDHLLILHTEMEAGHGGASGRFKSLEETALAYSFLLKMEEINQ